MDSRIHGVPLSATPMVPKAAPLNNKVISGTTATTTTIDESDFEFFSSSKSHTNSTNSSYSSSELESHGFGEDEFETESERHFGRNPDVGILEEILFLQEFTVSIPFVKNSNVEVFQESNERGFSRPPMKNPGEEIARERINGGKIQSFRPFVNLNWNSDSDGPDDSSESDEETVSVPIVDIRMPNLNRPIALISTDSDTESHTSELSEGDAFPEVRIPDEEEEEEFEIQGGRRMLDLDFVEQFKDEEKTIFLEGSIHTAVLSDTVWDQNPDSNEEIGDSSLAGNKKCNNPSEPERNEDFIKSDDDADDDRRCEMDVDDILDIGECPKIESDELQIISETESVETVEPFISIADFENKKIAQFSETELGGRDTKSEVENGERLSVEEETSTISSDSEAKVVAEERKRKISKEMVDAEAGNSHVIPNASLAKFLKASRGANSGKILKQTGNSEFRHVFHFASLGAFVKANTSSKSSVNILKRNGNSEFPHVTLPAFLKAAKGANSGIITTWPFPGPESFSLNRVKL